jgi:adenylate cyclase
MAREGFKRKLTTIISADVVGYSSLMEDNEEATIQTLNTYRNSMSALIQQHRGRLVDMTGDNLMAEFSSVVDAVKCAVETQKEISDRNADLPEKRRMLFRIGVNLGDIVEEDDRIYGDGVNIAARLEGLAEAGGICISRTAYDQVKKKLELGFEYLGEHSVKNISEPVRVYSVLMEPEAAGKVIGEKRFLGRFSRKTAMAAIIILAMLAGGLISWNIYLHQSKRVEPAAVEKMAFPLPEKPSLAILPFDNMSDDPQLEYLSDGITESLIAAVSKIHRLFVIARNSTFAYKGKPIKVQQISEDLGIQYVLEGSVQRSGERLRITAQLIDALNGRHMWSERYDRELQDLYALQDDIIMEILRAMRVKLTEGKQLLKANRPADIKAALKLYEANGYLYRFTPEANFMGKKLLEEVVVMEPEWGEAYYRLASAHMMDYWFGTTKSPKESFVNAIELTEKAISLDDNLAQAFGLLGYLYSGKREYEKGISLADKGVERDPNGADVHAFLGNCLNYAARPQEAIPYYEKALRLNPFAPVWYYIQLGQSYRMVGRYQESITQLKKSLAVAPKNLATYFHLCFTYIEMGKIDEARAAAAEVIRIAPKFSVDKFAKTLAFKDQDYNKRFEESLRKAGLK